MSLKTLNGPVITVVQDLFDKAGKDGQALVHEIDTFCRELIKFTE